MTNSKVFPITRRSEKRKWPMKHSISFTYSLFSLWLCGLQCFIQSTSAISITINEDSTARLDFGVVWGDVVSSPISDSYVVSPTAIFADDFSDSVGVFIFGSVLAASGRRCVLHPLRFAK